MAHAAAADGQVPGRDVSALPISRWRRYLLYRQGRLDGRRGHPDPTMTALPVTTPTRQLLVATMAERTASVRKYYAQAITAAKGQYDEQDRWLVELEHKLAAARRELEEVKAGAPDPRGPVQRSAGESHQPDTLIRRRRARAHVRSCGPYRQRCEDFERQITDAHARRAQLRAEIAGARWAAGDAVRRLRATYLRERAIYDRSLLRRHPAAELLRPVLDMRIPTLPAWVQAEPPIGGGEPGSGSR